jgi:hypothetical protein
MTIKVPERSFVAFLVNVVAVRQFATFLFAQTVAIIKLTFEVPWNRELKVALKSS